MAGGPGPASRRATVQGRGPSAATAAPPKILKSHQTASLSLMTLETSLFSVAHPPVKC